jgi:hypothetical protein
VAAYRKLRVPCEYSALDIELLLFQANVASHFRSADALYALATWVASYRDGGPDERRHARTLLRRAVHVSPTHCRSLVALCMLEGTSRHGPAARVGGEARGDEDEAGGAGGMGPGGDGAGSAEGGARARRRLMVAGRKGAVGVWECAVTRAPGEYRSLICVDVRV